MLLQPARGAEESARSFSAWVLRIRTEISRRIKLGRASRNVFPKDFFTATNDCGVRGQPQRFPPTLTPTPRSPAHRLVPLFGATTKYATSITTDQSELDINNVSFSSKLGSTDHSVKRPEEESRAPPSRLILPVPPLRRPLPVLTLPLRLAQDACETTRPPKKHKTVLCSRSTSHMTNPKSKTKPQNAPDDCGNQAENQSCLPAIKTSRFVNLKRPAGSLRKPSPQGEERKLTMAMLLNKSGLCGGKKYATAAVSRNSGMKAAVTMQA